MSTKPKLPPELERTIFELAANGDPQTMLRIILVAHRCRFWIEPILYRFVVVCQSSWSFPLFLRTIESRPAHYAKWIKAIQINPYIMPNDPAVTRILSICTGVVHLVDFSYGRTPFSVLAQLRLEKMCISLDIINGLTEGAYFRHPAFAHLTHLHILDPPYRWPNIPFSDLPSLTHLVLQNYKTDIRSSNIPVLKKILSDCPLLEVLVVIIPLCRPEDQNIHNMKLLVDDPRLVILSRALNHRDDILGIPSEEKSTEHGPEKIIASGARERLDSRPWATKTTRRRRKKRSGLNCL
ncbi:hypothetical protein B0H13DRAFT_2579665 [Mycena leptocephala]|nr:hypothetical protein B0H13DRAFT_2405966 [Mycena leptocephala]KAJ7924463.1 hypothetical protein B0H13DRAFT_2579665 [Mycena leptocephala]